MIDWKEIKLEDFISFNPHEKIAKGIQAKKIAMDKLVPFSKFIDEYEISEYNGGAKFRNGDTLLARITPCLENGKTAQVSILDNDEVGFGSTEFVVMRAKENISDKDFIYYLSINPQFRDIAIKSMVGSSGRQRVQQSVLDNTIIEIPPLNEQIAIVETLSCLDDKIELNNRINKNLEAQAQAIFKSWFIDFEPFQDGEFVDSELGKIPKGWRVGTLTEIANYLNGLAMQKYRPNATEKAIPVLKIKELRQRQTDSSTETCSKNIPKEYIINNGDVIFSWSGSLIIDIWCGGECGLNQHLFKITSEKYNRWFYYFWSLYHLEEFQTIAEDKATTMGHIKREHLNNAKIRIPGDGDYKKIDSVISPIIDCIIQNRVQSATLAAIRDNLLPKLMSGEVRTVIN